MFRKSYILLSVLALGACAYAIEDSVQDVKFVTPGAYNALCYAYVDKLRYKVRPPQTVNLRNAHHDLIVDCFAPGNRHVKLVIEPHLTKTAALNAANAGVGLVWDHASGALHKYPDVIEIDFTDVPITDMPLPAQNQPDIRQPEEYPLEEFSPGQPRLNSDGNKVETPILRRGETADGAEQSYSSGSPFYEDSSAPTKGDLMNVPGQ